MYDKDEINAVSMLYITEEREEDFELLLKALEPMISAMLLRIPQVREHWEDVKQEIFLHIWKIRFFSWFKHQLRSNIPADYFFFRIRELVYFWSQKTKREYDMYEPCIDFFEDLSAKEKRQVLDMEDPWEMWND
jgi:hypothetical protein